MKLIVVLAALVAMAAWPGPARAGRLDDTTSVEVGVRAVDGRLVPLTEPSRLGDGDWARVEYRDSKSRRAAMQVQVETAVPEANAAGISALVTAALMSTHRVKVFDPAVRTSHGAPKYILKVQVTEYEANKKGHGLGGLGGGLLSHATGGVVGGASLGSQKAEVEFTIQLLSAKTGEVLESSEIKGKSTSVHVGLSGINVGGVAPTDVETWSNPAVASAARVAAAKAAYKVFEWVGKAERT